MPGPYRALLLDYGGVLTTSVLDSFGAFCVAERIDVNMFRSGVLDEARAPESIFHAVETGRMQQEEFDERLAALINDACGTAIDPRGLKQRLFAASAPDERMRTAVRTARGQGIRTALVSNSWGGADYPREEFDELFDVAIISGEVGVRKPDREIYLLAADRLRQEPKRCVFVDDFGVNVQGAEAVGMKGLLHSDTGTTLAALHDLLGVDLDPGENERATPQGYPVD